MRNLLLRVITSVLLLPLVLYAFYGGGFFLKALLFLIVILCSYEMTTMILPTKPQFTVAISLASTALFGSLLMEKSAHSIPLLALILFLINLIVLFAKNNDAAVFEKITALFFGIFYVSCAIASLYWLRVSNEFTEFTGLSLILVACAATWGNDTCAYFGGRFLGKHPLFLRVSAKKTWEGFLFGAVGSILLVVALYAYLPSNWIAQSGLSWADCFFIVVPAVALAPLGDLIESRLKRFYNVKDSSQILPGHGGILDRIDGLLVVLPWTAAYAFIIRPLC